MNRYKTLFWTMLCIVTITSLPAIAFAKGENVRPNILIIVTDDQGYGDLSAFDHHASDIQTPNMDRIAEAGVLCGQAYVSAPVCSPSRAGWITGRYQQRWDPRAGWGPGVPENYKTLPEYLKQAGYVTGKVGKSDFGKGYYKTESRSFPVNHGYDEFLGFTGHGHDFFLMDEAT
jgi:arylsulfatase A-like enzyme